MPNEPVKCPNCGGGDVQQLAADSYTCEHCQTDFRWVNPTTSTVVHESRVCECGNNAVAYCVRCREPLCEEHRKGGFDLALRTDMRIPAETPPEIERAVMAKLMAKHRLPKKDAVLCEKCQFEWFESLAKAFPEEAPLPAPPPIIPPTKKASRESSLLGRLSDWIRGVGK